MIVQAQSYHLKDIVRMAQHYFAESPYAQTHTFESETLMNSLRKAMISPVYEVAVAEWDGKVIGAAYAYMADYAWCSDVRVNMEFIYVEPEYRNQGQVEQLIEHMISWSRRNQAKEMTAGDIGFRPKITEEFYKTQGFGDPGVMLRKVF